MLDHYASASMSHIARRPMNDTIESSRRGAHGSTDSSTLGRLDADSIRISGPQVDGVGRPAQLLIAGISA